MVRVRVYFLSGIRMVVKKCRFCAEEVQVEAIKCKYCGSMLNYWEDETTPVPHETHQQVDTNKHKISLEAPELDGTAAGKGLLVLLLSLAAMLYSLNSLFNMGGNYGFAKFCSALIISIILLVAGVGIGPNNIRIIECKVCSNQIPKEYRPTLAGEPKEAADIVNCPKCQTMHIVNWYKPN